LFTINKKAASFVVALIFFGNSGAHYPVFADTSSTVLTTKISEKDDLVLERAYLIESSEMAALALDIEKVGTTFFGLSKEQALASVSIRKAFGDILFPKAVKIAWCESRLNPLAYHQNNNGTTDRGLFQLNDGGTMQRLGVDKASAFDASVNATAARVLYEDRGWKPWVCG
jgi:hypothetical protein